jgi:hypothetical protein
MRIVEGAELLLHLSAGSTPSLSALESRQQFLEKKARLKAGLFVHWCLP